MSVGISASFIRTVSAPYEYQQKTTFEYCPLSSGTSSFVLYRAANVLSSHRNALHSSKNAEQMYFVPKEMRACDVPLC